MEMLLVAIAVIVCVGLPLFLIFYPICKGIEKSQAKQLEKENAEKDKWIKLAKKQGVSATEEQLAELSVRELQFLYAAAANKNSEIRKEELLNLI